MANSEYFDNIEDFTLAVDRIYNYCVFRDEPVRIRGHRAVEEGTGGIMYSFVSNKSSYEGLHQIRTTFEVDSEELFALSANLQQRLLRDGFLVDKDDEPFISHCFKIPHGKFHTYYYGKMSDEEAVIQGLRHGAVEILRVPQRTKGWQLGEIKI